MIPTVLSVIGRKGSGKSQVIETLIALLKSKGFRIGIIKHLAKDDVEIDQPGKDTCRYRTQGAETVILAGKRQLAFFSNLSTEIPVEQLLCLFQDYDLVFLDGYFDVPFPTLEVMNSGNFLSSGMDQIFAICSDQRAVGHVPHFSLTQLVSLVSLIEEKFLMVRGNGSPKKSSYA